MVSRLRWCRGGWGIGKRLYGGGSVIARFGDVDDVGLIDAQLRGDAGKGGVVDLENIGQGKSAWMSRARAKEA